MKKVLILKTANQKYKKNKYDLVVCKNKAIVNKITDEKVISDEKINMLRQATKYYDIEES